MSTYMYSVLQRRDENGDWDKVYIDHHSINRPFGPNYGVFTFLGCKGRECGSEVPVLPSAHRGLPSDFYPTDWHWADYATSTYWCNLSDLLEFDYSVEMINRQPAVLQGGGLEFDAAVGRKETLRQYLGEHYFERLEALEALGVERIIYGFD